MQRGAAWQQRFVAACILQIVVEVFLYETSECVWIHFLIPMSGLDGEHFLLQTYFRSVILTYNVAEMTRVRSIMMKIIDGSFLSEDPSYLFVSTKLAKRYPNLLESVLVRSYHNIFPGSISWKWQRQIRFFEIFNRDFWRSFGLTGITMAVLHWFGSFSPVFQKLIVHTVQPLMAAGLVLGIYSMIKNPIAFVPVGAVIILVIIYRLVQNKYSQAQQAVHKISAVSPQISDIATIENHSILSKLAKPNGSNTVHPLAPEFKKTLGAESSSPPVSNAGTLDKHSMETKLVRPKSGDRIRPMLLESKYNSSTISHIYDEPSSDEEEDVNTTEFDLNKVSAEIHSWYDENHNLIVHKLPSSLQTPSTAVRPCETNDEKRSLSSVTSKELPIKTSDYSDTQTKFDPPLEYREKDSGSKLQLDESATSLSNRHSFAKSQFLEILDISSSSGSDEESSLSDDSSSDESSDSDSESSDDSAESIESR